MASTYLFSRPSWHGLRLGIVLVVWLGLCALAVPKALNNPQPITIAASVLIVLLPLIILKIERVPIVLFGLYAALVPLSSLLVVGAGVTICKFLAIIAGASIILAIVAKHRSVRPSWTMLALAVLTAYAGATIFWSINANVSMKTFGTFLGFVVLYVAVAFYPANRQDVKIVVSFAIAGALMAAAYGAHQYITGQQVVENRLIIALNDVEQIDPNEFATALLMPVAIALVMFLRSRAIVLKGLWLTAVLVLLGGFMVTGSRGAFISFAVMTVYIAAKSRYRKAILGFAPVIVGALLVSPVGSRFLSGDVASGDDRFDIWKVGLAALHQYWFAGAGFGNFRSAFAQYYLTVPHHWLLWSRPAHSLLFQSAVELGAIGLFAVLAFWYAQFRELASVRTGDPLVEDLCLALRASIVGLFISALMLEVMLTKYTWLTFAVIALTRSMLVTSGASTKQRAMNAKVPIERARGGDMISMSRSSL